MICKRVGCREAPVIDYCDECSEAKVIADCDDKKACAPVCCRTQVGMRMLSQSGERTVERYG